MDLWNQGLPAIWRTDNALSILADDEMMRTRISRRQGAVLMGFTWGIVLPPVFAVCCVLKESSLELTYLTLLGLPPAPHIDSHNSTIEQQPISTLFVVSL